LALNEFLVIIYFAAFMFFLFTGYPVGFVLGGLGFLFAFLGDILRPFGVELNVSLKLFNLVAGRFFSTMTNINLVPVPLFIFMGIMMDRSGVATKLLQSLQILFRKIPGGLALAVILIGVILAATTGIIGASVVLLGTLALPQMLRSNYKKELALGVVVSSGTLGILIPPSIMLLVMADQMLLSVPDLFMAAMFPGLLLASLYVLYVIVLTFVQPDCVPIENQLQLDGQPTYKDNTFFAVISNLLPPSILILAVLGSIFFGIATPSEASGIGALGALLLSIFHKKLNLSSLKEACHATAKMTAFVFLLIYGAPCFALTLRELGGDEVISGLLRSIAGGQISLVLFTLTIVFILGFFLDWIEITVILIPLVLPIINEMQIDIYWFAILVAVCLQTSFLTPPMGPALFYVQGIAPEGIRIQHIYKGAIPFVILQLLALIILLIFPKIVTWLPSALGK